MRHETITGIARQLGVVLSKRVGQALGVWGEPGIGKTHSVQQVLQEVPCQHLSLHATAIEAAIFRALPRPRTLPAWIEAQFGRVTSGEPLEAKALADAVVAALSKLAPFVLHFEDLHEASSERLEMIVALAQAVTRTRGVGLLVTSRSQPPEPFRSHHLEPLMREESDALARAETGAELPPAGLSYVFDRAAGNPLFTLEFVRYLVRGGSFWSDGKRWNWRAPPDDYVPVTVEAMISQLVSNLMTPQNRGVLEARAILPAALTDGRVWADVAGVIPEVFTETRGFFERAGVLSVTRFTHPLIGEVIARELPHNRRREYARRAVGALEEAAPELAASFIDDAGLGSPEALSLLERAANRAKTQGENLRVAHLLGIAAGYASGSERVRLALEAEAELRPTSDYRQRERLARLALETQPENREARYVLVDALAQLGRLDQVEALLAELPEAERGELRWVDLLFRAQAMTQRAAEAIQTWRKHPELAHQPSGRSINHAILAYCDLGEMSAAEALSVSTIGRSDLPPRTRALVINSLAFIRSAQGRHEESQVLHDEGIAFKRQDGHASNLASGLYDRAINLDRLGRIQEALRDATEAIKLYDASGNVRQAANARAFLGYQLARRGDFPEAESALLEAHDTHTRLGVSINRVICERELIRLYTEWQPLHGGALALKFARDALEHVRTAGYTQLASHVLSTAACAFAWQNDGPGALALANEALERLGPEDSLEDRHACVVALARALEASAEPDRALERWREASELAQNLGMQAETREALLEIARLERDSDGGRILLEWFEQHDLGAAALRARRYFPQADAILAHPTTLRLNVLGSVSLERDAQPVPTRARKRTEILAYLLETRIAGRSEAGALEIVDALYPDDPEPEARNTLKQQVYLIRSSLSPESITSTPNGYALGAITSDAEDFLRTGDSRLWRGVYLSNLGEGWRSGVREALCRALHSKLEALLETDALEAARLSQVLCEMEPYDPDALRLAVRALETVGQAQAARSLFAAGRARLLEVGETLPAALDAFLTVVPA